MSSRAHSFLPEPFAEVGINWEVFIGIFGGACTAALLVVGEDPEPELVERPCLGTVPEVEAIGEEGVVLGFDEFAEEDDDEGRAALAEVLALGGMIIIGGACGGVGVPVGGLSINVLILTGSVYWVYSEK
jgi:hypothetical protein